MLESTSSDILEYASDLVKGYVDMPNDCGQYRKHMELLALRQKLEKGIADETERERIRMRIHDLEKELELD